MQNKLEISFVVPTNRPLAEVEDNIHNISRIASSADAQLIISDNRNDPVKREVLSKEFGANYYASPEPEAQGNNHFAIKKCTKRFSWHLHDDDWIFDLGGQLPTEIPDDYVAVCPIIMLFNPAQGAYALRNFDLAHNDPIARINAYASQSGGANSLLFAIWETELYNNISLVTRLHPCVAGYQDWSFIQAMLAEGKVLSTDRFGYRYNNNNWFGPQAAMRIELDSLFRRAELPPTLANHMLELQVLDLTCMFGRKHGYKQSLENRYKVLNSLLGSMISHFKPEELGNYIEQILTLIRRIDPQTGDRYQAYAENALDTSSMGESL